MKYADGQDVRLGDRVRLGDDHDGIVVASIDTDEYGDTHPKAQWGYLKQGILVDFTKYGLIHYQRPEGDLTLVARAR